ncbi:MAG: DUF554 domain-containing protein [Oscillospiraceae bacterium]|nr:DUF554 domain-containing protein [Oscillospiraceae bacterium]
MLGVLVNTLAVIVGGCIGLLCKKGIPERLSAAVMTALGLFTLCVGGMGVLGGKNVLVLLVSIVFGTLAGTVINIDGRIEKLGKKVEARFSGNGTTGGLAQSFVTATLMMCVGAMAVVGSIKAGTTGDCTLLYTKSVMDLIASLMLAVSLGAGVPLSAVCVFVFEGAVTLLGGVLAPVLTETMIAEMSAAGSLMILALGFNILGVTKIKVADMLPAIVFAPFVSVLFAALDRLTAAMQG